MAREFPKPEAGQVIRYSFLWLSEAEKGLEEGSKDRPCAVVLVVLKNGSRPLVRVLPITHTPPSDLDGAIELPPLTKRFSMAGSRFEASCGR
jgi:mRNA-degrading endonuclease toxin of MazEF toxin-antitoxin module